MFKLTSKPSDASAFLVVALAIILAPSTARAVTIPYTRALTAIHTPTNDGTPNFFTVDNQLSTSSPPAATSAASSDSGSWGHALTTAAADLAAGTLRARAEAANVGADLVYTQTNAGFGDGFRTTSPTGPFTWDATSTGRFTMDLSGTIASSPGLETLNAGAFVILALYQPNTLNPNANLVGVPNLISYYLYLLGNPNQNLYSCDFNGNCANLVPTGYYGSFPTQITQDITPGSDFDWAIVLGASGATNALGSYDINFANTLRLSYDGPAGATTTSVSGMFANINQPTSVPEPSALALLCFGFVGIGFLLRRRII